MDEIWKDIEGYPSYQVSSEGRVKSLKYGKEKILKSSKDGGGYLLVILCKDRKQKTFRAHRLVAQAFLDNPNNLLEVNHIDEDKTNNCVDNLEWCNRKYNTNYGTRNKRISKPILQFTKEGEFVKKWDSVLRVERELGFNQGNICSCLKGRYEVAGGYVWGYEKDYERIPFKVFDLELYKKVS